MPSRSLLRGGVAALSAALAALLGWTALAPRRVGATVELVDPRREVAELLEEARRDPAAPPGPELVRRPVPRELVRKMFSAVGKNLVYDPDMLARHRPRQDVWFEFAEHPRGGWRIRTNSLGLREDDEVAPRKEDLRVLVVGDSHVDGLCDNADSLPNVLERALAERHPELSVQVLNAATGSWGMYKYLGALEGYGEVLDPDVFVAVLYGGNDFAGNLNLHRFHRGEPPPAAVDDATGRALVLARRGGAALPAQFLNQAAYFHDHPGEEEAALQMCLAVTREMQRLCRARGTVLLCVYLPPWAHAQPESFAPRLAAARDAVRLPPEALQADERLADAWLGRLAEEGVAAVDLRPCFRAAPERPLYWETDHHLALEGHALAASALVEPLEAACGLAR